MAKSLVLFACLVAALNGAPVDEKFLPFLSSDPAAVATAVSEDAGASAAADVNASPVIVSPGSAGKKVQITITKEVSLGHHGGVAAGGHEHAAHHGHVVHQAAAPSVAKLHLDNGPVVIDNETVTGVLQNLLAGNIQNVQAHGQPLAVPPGGKPVAVIFSSAMHVVDIGDLQPPKVAATHGHHGHNHTQHAAINHTSILENLMSPLISLTHLGGHAQVPVATGFAQPVQMQPMQMQPIVVMMPMAQQMPATASIDGSAQLGGLLQGLLAAKQQILQGAIAGHSGHAAAAAVPVAAAAPAAAATVTATAATAPVAVAAPAATGAVAISGGVPVVAVAQPRKTKKIDISITKTKTV